jgi:hypothetical protein
MTAAPENYCHCEYYSYRWNGYHSASYDGGNEQRLPKLMLKERELKPRAAELLGAKRKGNSLGTK